MMHAETATALPSGSLRQCICCEDIEIGAPIARNAHGVACHPQCAGLTPREAQAQAHNAVAAPPRQHYAGPVAVGAPDLGDLVADRIEAIMGIERRIEREHTPDRHVAQVLAPRHTAGGRDLGDEVADRIEIEMFGAIRGNK